MAEVTVFVDTALFGILPPICVKDGLPTTDHLTIHSEVSSNTGLGIAWLLILFGPLGWLGLIVIALTRNSADVLTVKLPFSELAYQRYRSARRLQHAWLIGALALAALAVISERTLHPLGALAGAVLGLCALSAFVVGLHEWRRADSSMVGVRLDASHRWVTLSRVHADFARAMGRPGHSPWPDVQPVDPTYLG